METFKNRVAEVDGRVMFLISPAGTFHRENGPAVIFPGGELQYYSCGLRHRSNGPAVIYSKDKFYFEYDNLLSEIEYFFLYGVL